MADGSIPSTNAPKLGAAAHRNLCTDCGLSRMKIANSCGKACQFIDPDYPESEIAVHGRARDVNTDELYFGPVKSMYRARLKSPKQGAQWTGITTELGAQLLRNGTVDAVLCIGPDPSDRWKPRPILVSTPEGMAEARGMRMGYAPLLALLEPASEAGHKRIAIIGIPCQVFALRQIEKILGFEALYVIGTPCSDNTSTENFHTFLNLISETPDDVTYLEFRADYRVELRHKNGSQRLIPFLKLPLSDLDPNFFPTTCRSCVDYTNALADVTVGYMAGEGDQWLLIRNELGQEIVDGLGGDLLLQPVGTRGKRHSSVAGFIENTKLSAGGLPLRRMPDFMRGIMGWLMPRIGPRGLEFAKARVEMKAAETVLHLRRQHPKKIRSMVPNHVWKLVAPYGLAPEDGEQDK